MTQQFNACVEGGVAARDVHNIAHQHQTLVRFPDRKPESQLQAEFALRTGIWCPKAAREWLESLLNDDGFTVRELSRSWRAGSLGWDARTNERRISTPWFELFGAAFLMVAILSLFLVTFLVWATTPIPRSIAADVTLFGIGFVTMGTMWLVEWQMLRPRRIALRVRRVNSN